MKKKGLFLSSVIVVFVLNTLLFCNVEKSEQINLASLFNLALADCEGGEGGVWTEAMSIMTIGLQLEDDASCPEGLRAFWCYDGDCVECFGGEWECTESWDPSDLGCL